jgi:cytochrome c553
MRLVLLSFWFFCAMAMAAPPKVEDTIGQRALACTSCHGKEGRAGPDGYYPRIAGKPAGYLYNQLLNFREGRRHYGLMARLLDPLSEPYVFELAQYFASLDLPYPSPQPATLPPPVLERGRVLATQGDAPKKIPACVQCHGDRLTGAQPNTPGLLGVSRDYLNAQLGAWRAGQRRAQAPDCMAQIAKQLAPEDLTAVAAWLAAQPLPADSHPVASIGKKPPLECGSAAAPQAKATPARVEAPAVARGAYLARVGNCIACHTERGGMPFAGGRAIETPFGTVYSSNLTADRKAGIGAWSADDFWRALHEGRSREGRLLYPAFPYPNYTQVSREDSDAIYAFLRSLPAASRANTPHRLRWPYGTQAALWAWRTMYFKAGAFEPDKSKPAEWNRGAYLVSGLAHCSACHTTRNALGAQASMMDLSGGVIPMQNWYAPSLASKSEASVADWDIAHVERLLLSGVAPRGTVLGPMAEVVRQSTQYLSTEDARAMAVFLKAVPEPANEPGATSAIVAWFKAMQRIGEPDRTAALPGRVAERGAKIYGDRCAQCHGDQGEGHPGVYPALAGNRAVNLPVTSNLVQVVLGGGFPPVTAGNPRPFGMPPYATALSDEDIAAVISYIRMSWGNRSGAVSEFEVAQQRSSTAP